MFKTFPSLPPYHCPTSSKKKEDDSLLYTSIYVRLTGISGSLSNVKQIPAPGMESFPKVLALNKPIRGLHFAAMICKPHNSRGSDVNCDIIVSSVAFEKVFDNVKQYWIERSTTWLSNISQQTEIQSKVRISGDKTFSVFCSLSFLFNRI